jgi:hypothetical protein
MLGGLTVDLQRLEVDVPGALVIRSSAWLHSLTEAKWSPRHKPLAQANVELVT